MKAWAVPAVSIALGLPGYWSNRHVMYPDGVSYLEIGDAIFRDGWMAAANGCWSPLLALLAGTANAVFQPSPYGEFRLANGVNFGIYIASVAVLEWAIRRYWARYGESAVLPRFSFGLLLHAVNVAAALMVTGMNYFTPDILLMACVSLALGALFGPPAAATAALFGLALGLGYLAKAAFLATAALLWIAAAAIWRERDGWLRDLAISGAVFTALAALYFVPVSLQKRRFTLAENGRVNYLTHVLGVRSPALADPRFGPPAIPVESLSAAPAAYALPNWKGVIYPFHYDVSRFYDGWRVPVTPAAHAAAAGKSLRVYGGTLRNPAVMLLLLTAIALMAGATRRAWHPLSWLLLPVFGTAAVFALVHVEPRYTAPLFVPGCFGVLASLGPAKPDRRRMLVYVVSAAALGCALFVLRGAVGSGLVRENHPEARFAAALAASGVRRGDPVAVVGFGYSRAWARVGGYRIAAEAPDRAGYSQAPAAGREALAARLRSIGIRAMVIQGDPPQEPGWTKARDTSWSYRVLE